jgi:hypothetical protein
MVSLSAKRDILLSADSLRREAEGLAKQHGSNGRYFWTRNTLYDLRQRLWRIDRVLRGLKKPIRKCFDSGSTHVTSLADLNECVHFWLSRSAKQLNLSADEYSVSLRVIVDNSVELANGLEEDLEHLP